MSPLRAGRFVVRVALAWLAVELAGLLFFAALLNGVLFGLIGVVIERELGPAAGLPVLGALVLTVGSSFWLAWKAVPAAAWVYAHGWRRVGP